MLLQDTSESKTADRIRIKCDDCAIIFDRTLKNIRSIRKRRDDHVDLCTSCSAKHASKKRPQNSKEFWDSYVPDAAYWKSYYKGIAVRASVAGENNPMYGKTFSANSKELRKSIWQERTGELATNWQGGKKSILERIKHGIKRRYNWYDRVKERDACCVECGSEENLHAHHIKPMAVIVRILLHESPNITTEKEKYDYLIECDELINSDLSNGITLCYDCHRDIHTNWGSHEPEVRKRCTRNEDEKI